MRRFLQIALLLLLLVTGGGGWYLYRKGLTRPWRELVVEELRRRGVEVAFGSLVVEPFRGLVAKDVRVFDSPARKRTLVRVNEMVVEANYANAVRGRPFLDSLTLVNADVAVPLDARNPAGPVVSVEGLSTRIVLPPDRVVISRLDAVVLGVKVSASGQIVHPEAFAQEPSPPDGGPDDLAVVTRVLDELRAVKFLDRPRLDVRFGGDLRQPDSLVVEAALSTGRMERGSYTMEALDVTASWRNSAFLLHRFEARDAVGRLHLAGAYTPESRELDVRLRSGLDLAALLRTAGLWEPGEFRFESAPQIDAVMRAKFEKPGVPRAKRDGDGRMDLSGHVRLGRFAFGEIGFDQLSGDFAWDGKRWAVRDFLLKNRDSSVVAGDVMQDFDAAGNGTVRVHLDSNLNPEYLAPFFRGTKDWQREATEWFSRVKFPDAPVIAVEARQDGDGPVVGAGRVKLGRFEFDKLAFDRLGSEFSWDGKQWRVGNFVLTRHGGGEIRGDASQAYDPQGKGDFRANVKSTINPESLMPFFQGTKQWQRDAAARLALFKFPDAPEIDVSARGTAPGFDTMSMSAGLKLRRASYRGVDLKSLNASLRFSNGVLHADNIDIQRAEGPAAGDLTFDFNKDLVFVKHVRLGVFPQDVALWIDPDLVKDISPYRFGKLPPYLEIDGVVDRRRGGKNTRLNVKLDADHGMNYTFLGKELKFGKVDAKMAFDDERMKLTDVRAELFDGLLKGNADISILRARPGHAAEVRFIDVNFEKLTKLYFDYNDSKGKLNGVYNFNGKGDDGRTMKGEGKLDITEGNVFAIPFLGPFSDLLNKIVPGLGYNLARHASLTFAIADGVMETKNLEIEGKGFSMFGDGRIWFLEDRMDMNMRLNAQGLPGMLLLPVSELLEYRSVSKFSEPEWRAKVIPKINIPGLTKPVTPPVPVILKKAPKPAR